MWHYKSNNSEEAGEIEMKAELILYLYSHMRKQEVKIYCFDGIKK